MACGVPALVSDAVGCAPDLVRESETGFTYPCGDITRLAALMTRVAADASLRARMGAAARAHVEKFTFQYACDGVMQALESLQRQGRIR